MSDPVGRRSCLPGWSRNLPKVRELAILVALKGSSESGQPTRGASICGSSCQGATRSIGCLACPSGHPGRHARIGTLSFPSITSTDLLQALPPFTCLFKLVRIGIFSTKMLLNMSGFELQLPDGPAAAKAIPGEILSEWRSSRWSNLLGVGTKVPELYPTRRSSRPGAHLPGSEQS
jgi:hypothetical protein